MPRGHCPIGPSAEDLVLVRGLWLCLRKGDTRPQVPKDRRSKTEGGRQGKGEEGGEKQEAPREERHGESRRKWRRRSASHPGAVSGEEVGQEGGRPARPPPPPALGPGPGLFLAGAEFSCSLGNSSAAPGNAPAGLGEKPGSSRPGRMGEEGREQQGARKVLRPQTRELRLRSGPKFELLVFLLPCPPLLLRGPRAAGPQESTYFRA